METFFMGYSMHIYLLILSICAAFFFLYTYLRNNRDFEEQESVDGIIANKESLRLYDAITRGTCPVCSAQESFLQGPEGGMAVNIKCQECQTRYWLCPGIRGLGAHKL